MNDGRDVAIGQDQAIIPIRRGRLVGKAKFVQRSIEPVSAAIARENPPGAVSPMRCRSQAYDQQLGCGVSKAGDRLAPVGPLFVSGHLFSRDLLAPLYQSRALKASRDL